MIIDIRSEENIDYIFNNMSKFKIINLEGIIMVYSIHTFELTGIFEQKKKYGRNASALGKGIKVMDYDYYDGAIRLKVNPSKVLGGDDLELWKPTDKNISKLLSKLDEYKVLCSDFNETSAKNV